MTTLVLVTLTSRTVTVRLDVIIRSKLKIMRLRGIAGFIGFLLDQCSTFCAQFVEYLII